MNYQTMMVTPQMAQQWLDNGGKNRKLSKSHVNRLTQEILKGRWVLNGQTVSFSTDGKLLDGQHRLSAVVQSGMTIPMSITFGVTDERAFETYDVVQKSRGAHDILSLDNIKNSTNISAIARRLVHWERTNDKSAFTMTSISRQNILPQDVVDYTRQHVAEISSVYDEIRYSPPYRTCAAGSAFVAALVLCSRVDDVATLVFMEGLKTGASLEGNSPVYLLRERLLSGNSKRGYRWGTEVMAITIKAWNKFTNNETAKVIKWIQTGNSAERFPIPGGK